ncbi:hypothetical protein J3458_005474 [Metarhizium acridum]|uniref:uncharacterized protein n=1 Tax=Metarhizium acridum TaxID=92637 RepID=UPI001C6C72EC|nr:hypothetical protein J3458_005474 [Metarhizium acridum]
MDILLDVLGHKFRGLFHITLDLRAKRKPPVYAKNYVQLYRAQPKLDSHHEFLRDDTGTKCPSSSKIKYPCSCPSPNSHALNISQTSFRSLKSSKHFTVSECKSVYQTGTQLLFKASYQSNILRGFLV